MVRLLKVIAVLIVFLAIGVAGFALFGDLTPERERRAIPVTLDAG